MTIRSAFDAKTLRRSRSKKPCSICGESDGHVPAECALNEDNAKAAGLSAPPLIGGSSARKLKAHPAADLFPMMTDTEISELGRDIKAQGQRHPIVILDGLILDGRNRYEACRREGIEPRLEQWSGTSSPTAYVLSENLQRRHLTVDQRALIALEAQPLFATEAKARQRAAGGDRKSSKAQPPDRLPPRGGKRSAERSPTAAAQAAETAGVSARSVERAQRVQAARPELLAQVRAGTMTLKKAEKAVAKGERLKEVLTYVPPKGRFSVIVADPPWKFDDQLDGSDAVRGGLDYPPMELEEICAMKVGENLATPNCALWLWVPNGFLLDGQAHQVIRAWGFVPKALLTWCKDRWGGGHYLRGQTEHVILATRGRPLVEGSATASFFHAKRFAHSEKPDEAYPIFETVTPAPAGSRLDLFACKTRRGWVSSGSEVTGAEGVTASKRKASKATGAKEPRLWPYQVRLDRQDEESVVLGGPAFKDRNAAVQWAKNQGHRAFFVFDARGKLCDSVDLGKAKRATANSSVKPPSRPTTRSRSKKACSICGEQDGHHLPAECALNEANASA